MVETGVSPARRAQRASCLGANDGGYRRRAGETPASTGNRNLMQAVETHGVGAEDFLLRLDRKMGDALAQLADDVE